MDRRELIALASFALVACGSSGMVPLPPTGSHEGDTPSLVPYPPPPSKVEVIAEKPPNLAPTAVWIDGQWHWESRRWVWEDGGWKVPPPKSYYAKPTTVRLADQTIVYFTGAWHPMK
jgi:hypothetical protein